MTAQPTFRDQIAGLEAVARANGEADFADLLRCFRTAYALEARDSEETRDAAYGMMDEAKRLVERFEQSADYLDDLAGYDRSYAREGV